MKNIKNTTREERDNRLEELKKKRKIAVAAYIKAKAELGKIDLEMAQIETANNTGHFIEIGGNEE